MRSRPSARRVLDRADVSGRRPADVSRRGVLHESRQVRVSRLGGAGALSCCGAPQRLRRAPSVKPVARPRRHLRSTAASTIRRGQARRISPQFVQRRPLDGAPATEQTEVFIAYDSEQLYFGIYAHYSEPSLVRANRVDRDQIWNDDRVSVIFDPVPRSAAGLSIRDQRVRRAGRRAGRERRHWRGRGRERLGSGRSVVERAVRRRPAC